MQSNAGNCYEQKVKVYFRTFLKFAKVETLPKNTSADFLKQFVSINFNIPLQKIHLYYRGMLIKSTTSVLLQDNSIIHIVNTDQFSSESIKVNVKKLKGRVNVVKFQIQSNVSIKDFIDDKLFKAYGQKSDQIFLIYVGRQLRLNCTFQEEEVQNESELLCLDFKQHPQNQIQNDTGQDYSYVIRSPANLQAREPSKDIYPMPNFILDVPKDIDTIYNRLNFIFDPKIMHASSIQNYDMDPKDVIMEQDSHLDMIRNESHSYQSDIIPQEQSQFRQMTSGLSVQCSQTNKMADLNANTAKAV